MPRLDGLPYLDKPVVYFAAEAAAMEVPGRRNSRRGFRRGCSRLPPPCCWRGLRGAQRNRCRTAAVIVPVDAADDRVCAHGDLRQRADVLHHSCADCVLSRAADTRVGCDGVRRHHERAGRDRAAVAGRDSVRDLAEEIPASGVNRRPGCFCFDHCAVGVGGLAGIPRLSALRSRDRDRAATHDRRAQAHRSAVVLHPVSDRRRISVDSGGFPTTDNRQPTTLVGSLPAPVDRRAVHLLLDLAIEASAIHPAADGADRALCRAAHKSRKGGSHCHRDFRRAAPRRDSVRAVSVRPRRRDRHRNLRADLRPHRRVYARCDRVDRTQHSDAHDSDRNELRDERARFASLDQISNRSSAAIHQRRYRDRRPGSVHRIDGVLPSTYDRHRHARCRGVDEQLHHPALRAFASNPRSTVRPMSWLPVAFDRSVRD